MHERAWVTVIDGEVEITTAGGESVAGGSGLMVEFAPGERHAVLAQRTARLLLLLTPWPGDGHPGAMSLERQGDGQAARGRAPRDPVTPAGAATSASGHRGCAAPPVRADGGGHHGQM